MQTDTSWSANKGCSFTAFDQALEFRKNRTVPSNWKTELKEDSSSSEAEEEEEDEKEKEDNSSEEEASEVSKGHRYTADKI